MTLIYDQIPDSSHNCANDFTINRTAEHTKQLSRYDHIYIPQVTKNHSAECSLTSTKCNTIHHIANLWATLRKLTTSNHVCVILFPLRLLFLHQFPHNTQRWDIHNILRLTPKTREIDIFALNRSNSLSPPLQSD